MKRTECAASDAVRTLLDGSGMSGRALAQKMGYEVNTINNVISRGETPRINRLVKIANACGYRVEVAVGDSVAEVVAED